MSTLGRVSFGCGLLLSTLVAPSIGLIIERASGTPEQIHCSSAIDSKLYPFTPHSRWFITADMQVKRGQHTASLLSGGRVLVVGGLPAIRDGDVPLADAELYYYPTCSWSRTGSLQLGRTGHTATVLPNGQVRVAGGEIMEAGVRSVTATAELYSPQSGGWALTGEMLVARAGHSATLLPDGRVLVAGGTTKDDTGRGIGASAEVYDFTMGRWEPAGVMGTRRADHTATLLPSGRVVVAGGRATPYAPERTAELFDPATGHWVPTASMATRRAYHTASLLKDGKVLVTGGVGDEDILASCEILDPVAGRWFVASDLSSPSFLHTATLLRDGSVLVAGVGSGGSTMTAQYQPAFDTWFAMPSTNIGHFEHSVTVLPNGFPLIAGGDGGSSEVLLIG